MGPRGVNAFIIAGEGPVIVDAGIPGSAPEIVAALAGLGFSPDAVALIIITHAHVDHAGDALKLRELTGAPVLAHRLDVPGLLAGVSAPVLGRTPEARAMLERIGADPGAGFESVAVDIVVDDPYDLGHHGLPSTAIHTPGHTDGGLTVILATGAAIVGDLISGASTDLQQASLGPFATDAAAMQASVARVLGMGVSRVYCGHGGPFGGDSLTALRASLGREAGS